MTEAPTTLKSGARTKTVIWLLVAGGLFLMVAANWHLVYVATASQPDCVDHLRHGEGDAERGRYSAARSSCSPR